MRHITIHTPIWKTRSIGIADYKITENLTIDIITLNNNNERLYPNRYYISKEKALEYPTQTIRGGVVLHIIPIADLEVYKVAV